MLPLLSPKWLLEGFRHSKVDSCDKNKPTVGITIFGVTNPSDNAVKDRLHKEVHIIFKLRDSNSLISHH